MVSSMAFGQNRTIKGQVVSDTDGEPLTGAAIVQKGTSNGVVADVNGNFTLTVPNNSVLVVSYIGFTTQQVKPTSNNITIRMKEDAALLSDIVVVGYGTMKKSDITGSVVSVDTKEMMKRVPTNVAQALQGAAAGVIVTQQDGAPDANTQVRVRGIGSINNTSLPLYVVDGVKVGTDANFVNPADIESMEVLKDASATAIYGSEGANGVIMITTKHGAQGKTQVQFTADFGLAQLPYKIRCVGVDEVAKAIRTAKYNDDPNYTLANSVWEEKYDGQRNSINWQDRMTRTGIKQQYGISAMGGNDKTQYNFSVGYLNNKGIIVNTNYSRLTARAGVKSKVNNYLEFGGDMNYVRTESKGSNIGLGNNINVSSHRDLAYMTPTLDYVDNGKLIHVNPVNPDGSYGTGTMWTSNGWEGNTNMVANIYATQMEINRKDRMNRIGASAYLDFTFLKDLNGHSLNLRSIGSWSHTSTDNDNFTGGQKRFNYINGVLTEITPLNGLDTKYSFDLGQSQSTAMGIETYMTYKWETDFNTLTVMAGNTVSKSYGTWVGASAYDFPSSTIRLTSLGLDDAKKKGQGGFNTDVNMISYYGRLVYNLYDRYILTATLRRDGSSNFSKGNQWGTFPSTALAWRVKEESFLKDVDAISNAKIRLGWGQTGNAGGIAGKSVYALSSAGVKYNFYNGAGIEGGRPIKTNGYYAPLVDRNLKWETNEQWNVGADLGLLNGELNITFDWFIRNTKDLLIDLPIRQSSGYSSIYTNYGNIRNTGVEFSINYNKRINKDWSVNATLNASTIKNKVTKLTELPIYAQATGGNSTFTSKDGADGIGGDGSNAFQVDGGANWDGHSISKVGEAVGSFYGYRTDGIFQTQEEIDSYTYVDADGNTQKTYPNAKPGDFKFKDLDGNKIIDGDDREVLGSGLPKFNYGLNLGAQYKNWDFSVYMYGVFGQKILSYSAMRMSTMWNSDDNTSTALLKKDIGKIWSADNTDGTLPRLTWKDDNKNMRVSDAWVKNGNFLKISNIQIGYTFDKALLAPLKIQGLRVYASIQNLCTISPYTQYGDPECGQGSVLFTGLDTGRYPNPRTYMVGLNVTF